MKALLKITQNHWQVWGIAELGLWCQRNVGNQRSLPPKKNMCVCVGGGVTGHPPEDVSDNTCVDISLKDQSF